MSTLDLDLSTEDDEDVEDARRVLEEIEGMAEEVPERAREFAEGCVEKAHAIVSSCEERGRVTANQMLALSNMRDGLEKWLD